jgi:tetratricopeptide (TPR) repeat protein
VLLGERRADEARARFRDLEQVSDVYAGIARLYLATIDILEGQLPAAEDRLRTDVVADRNSRNLAAEVKRRSLLGQLAQLRGNRAEALDQARAILEAGLDRLGPNELRLLGTLLASANDRPRATTVLQQLNRLRGDAPIAFVESCYYNLAGEIALVDGKPAEAAEAYGNAAARYPRALTTRGLARAYTAQHDWPRAIPAWEEVLAARGEFLHEGFVPDLVLSHLQAARAHLAAGDASRARAAYDLFLAMWGRVADLPVVTAAGAERRALDASGR